MVDALEGFACAAAVTGDNERAARFFGAASGLRDELKLTLHPSERACLEPYLVGIQPTRVDPDAAVDEALAMARPYLEG